MGRPIHAQRKLVENVLFEGLTQLRRLSAQAWKDIFVQADLIP